jgi:hypothetical protein
MRTQVFLIFVFLSIIAVPFASPEESGEWTLVASKPLPEQSSSETVIHENFLSQNGPYEVRNSPDMVLLSWWKWSEETNSDWPIDDAQSRLGELGLEDGTLSLFNEAQGDNLTLEEGLLLGQQHSREQQILALEGSIEIVSNEYNEWFLRFPVEMTPLVNLSGSTVLYFFITEDDATDNHGRKATHLVRDMKPEIGFSNMQGNTTETVWEIPHEHLIAAGIDLESNPYGWHITLAFFGEAEGDDTNRLLALYHTSLPTRWENSTVGHLALPVFLLIFASVLASGAVGSALKREKGMPKLNAEWIDRGHLAAHFTFRAGNQKVTLKSCESEPPWQIKGGFKTKRIAPHSELEFTLRFKERFDTDCQISLGLEVEELGTWTQYLRLSTPPQLSTKNGQSVETNEHEASDGEPNGS